MTPSRVIVADPAWAFADKLPGPKRGAESHYNVLSAEDICMLELPPIADDALLFLWRVAAMQQEALNVMHMWGFDLKSEIVWVKTKNGIVEPEKEEDLAFGMGHYTRHCHEVCLIGSRGRGASLIKNRSVRSVFYAEREEHSKKPDKFFSTVMTMTGGEGPYLELFARQQRPGWTCIGDELGTTLRRKDATDNGTQGQDRDAGGDSAVGRGRRRRKAPKGGAGSQEAELDPRSGA